MPLVTYNRKDLLRSAMFFLLAGSCLVCFNACKSDGSWATSSPKDPYAENAPKDEQEKEYYRDVYTGDWREQSNPFGMGKSVCRKNGSTSMPPHWGMMPHGAKTMTEIRAENYAKKMSENGQQIAGQAPVRPGTVPMNAPVPQMTAQTGAAPIGSAPWTEPPTMSQNVPQVAMNMPQSQPPAVGSAPIPYNAGNTAQVPSYSGQSVSAPLAQNGAASMNNGMNNGTLPLANNPVQTGVYPQAANPVQTGVYPQAANPVQTGVYPQAANPVQTGVYPQAANPVQTGVYPQAANPVQTGVYPQAANPVQTGVYPQAGNVAPTNLQPASGVKPGVTSDFPVINSIAFPAGGQAKPSAQPQKSVPLSQSIQSAPLIVRGQAPSAPLPLRSRMRNSYFSHPEPIRVAQGPMQQSGADRIQDSNATGTGPRLGGTVMPMEVDPKLAEQYAVTDPVKPTPKVNVNRRQKEERSYEYIFDGGDRKGEFYTDTDWHIHHLDVEDTVGHFDTVEGGILTEPSNRVEIYSPRFGSVRQVLSPTQGSQLSTVARSQTDLPPITAMGVENVDIRSQDVSTSNVRRDLMPSSAESMVSGNLISVEMAPAEDRQYDRTADISTSLGTSAITMQNAAAMMAGQTAAEAWGGVQKVAVDIDSVRAQVNIYQVGAEALVSVKTGTKSSKLRLIKIANKKTALPGELIEFTLRYENVGDEVIGNVTLMDNLSPRLEFVTDSAKSSRKGEFLVEKNEVGSSILRWEITEPLKKGEFGVVQFICKVR